MDSRDQKRWDDLRRRAEAALDHKQSGEQQFSEKETRRLIQELRVAQAELEIQNEELRASQTALEISRKHYQNLFNGAPVGYLVLDRIGMIQQANEAFCHMVGSPPAHVTHHSLRSFVVESERSSFDQQFPALFHRGRRRVLELTLKGVDRSDLLEVRLEGTVVDNLHPEQDQQTNLLVAVSDITATKSLERRLWESQKLEATGQLAGGIAHDFNNILTVIQATIEVARFDLPEDSPVRKFLKQIEQSGARAAALVRQLMAFAQTDKGVPQVLDLAETPLLLESMLRRLIPESVRFEWVVDQDLHHVYIDPVKLDQVLTNLVLNSRDAVGASGFIRVHFFSTEFDAAEIAQYPDVFPGDYLAISVEDDGHGMTGEVREKIFEPFFTTKPQGKGTGLGLSTVYGIVRQNQGFIKVQSQPGQGSTFTVYLPRTRRESPGPGFKQQAVQEVAGNERVMLVEDDPLVLALAKRLLARRGYEVTEFEDSQQALAWFKEHRAEVDVILSDVVMPGLNGPELVSQARALRPGLPYLFMSGYHREEQIFADGQLDGAEVLRKPFDAESLLKAIRRVLGG